MEVSSKDLQCKDQKVVPQLPIGHQDPIVLGFQIGQHLLAVLLHPAVPIVLGKGQS